MFQRLRLAAGVVILTIPLAHASDLRTARSAEAPAERLVARTVDDAGENPATPSLLRADLAALFAHPGDADVFETEDGVMALGGPTEVVLARIGPDGKTVMACVDTEAAARRFLEAAPERLPARRQEK